MGGGRGGRGGEGGLTITWWKGTARGRVQEGQKFYGYKHPLKRAWIRGGGGGGGGAVPHNPENQF